MSKNGCSGDETRVYLFSLYHTNDDTALYKDVDRDGGWLGHPEVLCETNVGPLCHMYAIARRETWRYVQDMHQEDWHVCTEGRDYWTVGVV
jgi:hypothetical protein